MWTSFFILGILLGGLLCEAQRWECLWLTSSQSSQSHHRRTNFRQFWILTASLFYLHHIRSCAAVAWGASLGQSLGNGSWGSCLQPGNCMEDFLLRLLLSGIRVWLNLSVRASQVCRSCLGPIHARSLIKACYFLELLKWHCSQYNLCGCLCLATGLSLWSRNWHLPRPACRIFSLLLGFLLTHQMRMTWRLELLSAIYILPPFPSDVPLSSGRTRDNAVVSHTADVDMTIVELEGAESTVNADRDDAWLESLKLRCCRVCGKSISCRIASMVHPRCWPQERLHQRGLGLIAPPEVSIEDLPSLHDIFTSPIYTKEHLPAELWPLLREEYGKLLARVNCFAEMTAWDPLPTHLGGAANGSDNDAKKQTRCAWLELLMFPKTVLRQNRRGQRRGQALSFTRSLLLRWRLGERRSLWDEAIVAVECRPLIGAKTPSRDATCADAGRLVALGRPGQALKRLTSPGLARDTPEVRAKLMAKFPPAPATISESSALPPTPEIPGPTLLRALRSFPVGSGPGPDGLRPDFLKGLIGSGEDSSLVPLLAEFVQKMADGQIPHALRPWLAGGTLVGVGKVAKDGSPVPLDRDARPIVMGQVFRKLVGKCLYRMDLTSMRQRLLPTQLAVGLSNGAETLVHACREWIGRNRDREDVVLLQKDVKNAFNELLPVQFIQDARQFAPASARFVEWCYGADSHLVYRGRLESSSRGQQGCPLMMALFCLTRKRMAEAARVAAGVHPEFEPEYADDAFSGGLTSHVLRSFQEEIRLAAEFGLRYDLEQCTLYLLSGEHFRGDVSGFQALGVRVVTGLDVQILKAPVGGSEGFLREFCEEKQRFFENQFQALETYPRKHEAFHLLQQCTGFGQLNYLARTTPRSLLLDLCEWYDARFESILGQAVPSVVWQ